MKELILYILLYFASFVIFHKLRSKGLFEWDVLLKPRAIREARFYRGGMMKRRSETGPRFISRTERQELRLKSKHIRPLSRRPVAPSLYHKKILEQEKEDYNNNVKTGHYPDISEVSLRDDFIFHNRIANGQSAHIVLVERRSDGAQFVVKLFKPISRTRRQLYKDLGTHQDFIILKDLIVHPNMIRINGIDTSRVKAAKIKEGTGDLVFEHVSFNLDHFLSKLSEGGYICHRLDLRHIMRSLFSVLRHLKRSHIIHRGICSKAVYITDYGVVKLGDFGHAQKLGSKQHSELSKSPNVFPAGYIPPEVLSRKDYDYSADVWCVGMIMITIILQRNPLKGISKEELLEYMQTWMKFGEDTTHITVSNPLFREIRNILNDDADAMSLLIECLMWNPSERITPEAAKTHRFFKGIKGYQPSDEDVEKDTDDGGNE